MTPTIRHGTLEANGTRLHLRPHRLGPPLVLLHGWPEFWLTWEPVMARLADRFDLIAPDLRGFGDSPKPDEGPSDRAGPEVHAADLLALLDHLGAGSGRDRQPRCRRPCGTDLRPGACPAPDPAVLLRLPLSRHRAALGRARASGGDLVPVVPAEALGGGPGRLVARGLPDLFRQHAPALGRRESGRLRRRRCWRPGSTISSSPATCRAASTGMSAATPAASSRCGARSRSRRRSPSRPACAGVPSTRCSRSRGPTGWATTSPTSTPPLGGLGHFPHREDPDRAAAEIGAWFAPA